MTTTAARGRSAARPRSGAVSPYAVELAFAIDVARRAGELQMARAGAVGPIDYKSAKDVVTEVDHLSEALILDGIQAAFPGDALLAEETGPSGHEATSGAGRVWIVDPLDGTINYANGIPFHCVSIALVVDGRPVVGVVHDPVRGETFAATRGTKATLQPTAGTTPVAVAASEKEQVSDYVISMALAGRAVTSRARAVRRRVRVSRSMGSAALALAYVANGRFDAFVQQGGLSTWDIAAAGLIAERAGATVTNLEGGPWFDVAKPTRTIGLLAAPARHHRELLDLVAGV